MARAEVLKLIDRMAIPAIAAPMFLVSNPALTLACCAEGIMGSFPAHGTRSREEFQAWLDEMQDGIKRLEDAGKKPAPWAVNLVVHASNPRYQGDLELVEKYKVPVVLTSKGAPGDAIRRIHGWGAVALHDIANRRHAEKALEAGVDGVIAVAGPEATSAGVVLTGGGSQLDGITTLARDILKAPVRVAAPEGSLLGILDDFQGPSSAATLGLFSWVARSMGEIGIAEEPQAGLGGRLVGQMMLGVVEIGRASCRERV